YLFPAGYPATRLLPPIGPAYYILADGSGKEFTAPSVSRQPWPYPPHCTAKRPHTVLSPGVLIDPGLPSFLPAVFPDRDDGDRKYLHNPAPFVLSSGHSWLSGTSWNRNYRMAPATYPNLLCWKLKAHPCREQNPF